MGELAWAHAEGASLCVGILHPEGAEEPGAPIITQTDTHGTVADFLPWSGDGDLSEMGWDRDKLAGLDADFAAARWEPAERRLTLARDIAGIRPIFWTRNRNHVAFCSLAAPLVEAGLASPEPDEAMALGWAAFNRRAGPDTFLRHVKRVPAGHRITVQARSERMERYWRPRRTQIKRDEDLAQKVRTCLARAVGKRLPPGGDVAADLSGGLDSSSITALAADATAGQGRRVLGILARCAASERRDLDVPDGAPFAQMLAQRLPNLDFATVTMPHRGDEIGAADLAAEAPVMDATGPERDQFAKAAELAAQRGALWILSGYGGDETLSRKGHGALTEALLGGQWSTLSRELSALAPDEGNGRSRWRILARDFLNSHVPSGLERRLRRLAGLKPRPDEAARQFLKAEIRAKAHRRLGSNIAEMFPGEGRLSFNAEIMATRAARYGVGVAFPFLAREIIELGASLPERAFLRDGVRRVLLRDAMDGILPEMIRTRPKKIATDPDLILAYAERREALRESAKALRQSRAARFFDMDAIEAAIDALPEPEDALAELKRCARAGVQPRMEGAYFSRALLIARYLDAAHRRHEAVAEAPKR